MASSTLSPWLAMSSSGQRATNPSPSRSITAVRCSVCCMFCHYRSRDQPPRIRLPWFEGWSCCYAIVPKITAAPMTHSSVDCPSPCRIPERGLPPRPAPFAHRAAFSLLDVEGIPAGPPVARTGLYIRSGEAINRCVVVLHAPKQPVGVAEFAGRRPRHPVQLVAGRARTPSGRSGSPP